MRRSVSSTATRVAAPDALVLWEAQFGDFVNGAQIVIDQFLVAGRSKWGQTSRLTLLLPHGYEGNGPEHSSARLERFLQQGAQDNIRIANCTTSAQFFHLLRRQALDATARPLVVMTPKGLLRLRAASATLAELAEGGFQPVIDDPGADHARVRRLVLCSGKVYYDIAAHEERPHAGEVAVARLEQLYPFPVGGGRGRDRLLPAAAGDRVGAGRAAEHGRLALDPPPARRRRARELSRPRRRLRRPALARRSERGVSDGAPARAGPHRASGSRLRKSLDLPIPRLAAAIHRHIRRRVGNTRCVAKVWLKSRILGKSVRLADHWVERVMDGYGDIVWGNRRFRFSHAAEMRDADGNKETWLVFEDAGAAGLADVPRP